MVLEKNFVKSCQCVFIASLSLLSSFGEGRGPSFEQKTVNNSNVCYVRLNLNNWFGIGRILHVVNVLCIFTILLLFTLETLRAWPFV